MGSEFPSSTHVVKTSNIMIEATKEQKQAKAKIHHHSRCFFLALLLLYHSVRCLPGRLQTSEFPSTQFVCSSALFACLPTPLPSGAWRLLPHSCLRQSTLCITHLYVPARYGVVFGFSDLASHIPTPAHSCHYCSGRQRPSPFCLPPCIMLLLLLSVADPC